MMSGVNCGGVENHASSLLSVTLYMVLKGRKLKIHTIPETPYSIHCWHLNNKRKYIIDEGIQCFVCHHPPR